MTGVSGTLFALRLETVVGSCIWFMAISTTAKRSQVVSTKSKRAPEIPVHFVGNMNESLDLSRLMKKFTVNILRSSTKGNQLRNIRDCES